MNFALWIKALKVIPSVSKEEWGRLDLVSRWLVSSRAAVLVMTVISAVLAGLFALRAGEFRIVPWVFLTLGLVLAHATNNLFNDYTDYVRGVDKENYFRTLYGPQLVAQGLMSTRRLLLFVAVTAALVVPCAVLVFVIDGWDPMILALMVVGLAFVLFYTWPLKYIALGEISVLLVWGPLMIGGGYYVLARHWDWNVLWASAPYALIVTTVIFGKHIDKMILDAEKKIWTLPVLIGERAARAAVLAMLLLPFALVAAGISVRYFSPAMALVALAVPALVRTFPRFLEPKPKVRPEWFPDGQGGWPLYFAPIAFVYTRSFGLWFLAGLVGEVVLRVFLPSFWR